MSPHYSFSLTHTHGLHLRFAQTFRTNSSRKPGKSAKCLNWLTFLVIASANSVSSAFVFGWAPSISVTPNVSMAARRSDSSWIFCIRNFSANRSSGVMFASRSRAFASSCSCCNRCSVEMKWNKMKIRNLIKRRATWNSQRLVLAHYSKSILQLMFSFI